VLETWTGAMVGAFDAASGEPLSGSVLICAPDGGSFAIGELSRPRDGDQLYDSVLDLLEQPAPMRLQG
jgi:hypothetical protein